MNHWTLLMLSPLLVLAVGGCAGDEPVTSPVAQPASPAGPGLTADKSYVAVREVPEGAPVPTLVLTQAWFMKENGRPKPGPARMEMWRQTAEGWQSIRVEDAGSNVFHKALFHDGGILTIGAEDANLKRWTVQDGAWVDELLWTQSWGGKFDRLRDLEIGDVDGDGADEYVIATHDAGVIAVYNPPREGAEAEVLEFDRRADTFVHEIEIGDVDGDGTLEFFATPTDRNKANSSQNGWVTMYKWDGQTYAKTVVDEMGATHAKEILLADVDGDGTDELFSVLEAETGENKEVVKPVEIRGYTLNADGSFSHHVVATIDDRQTRFLLAGNFDADPELELVAAAMKTGLYLVDRGADGSWTTTNFETASSGFEHTTVAHDLDGDGILELYVAADEQRELRRYVFNEETGGFDRSLIGRIDDNTITWGIAAGTL